MPFSADKLNPKKLADALRNNATRVIGNEAVNFFKERFKKQDWNDTHSEPWKPRTSPLSEKRTGAHLLVQSGRLRRSIRVLRADAHYVSVGTDSPYARIHNEGGEITITPKMKAFFWAMYFKHGGKEIAERARADKKAQADAAENPAPSGKAKVRLKKKKETRAEKEAAAWKNMALKKIGDTIKIEKRQFFGNSTLLNERIENKLINMLVDLLNPS